VPPEVERAARQEPYVGEAAMTRDQVIAARESLEKALESYFERRGEIWALELHTRSELSGLADRCPRHEWVRAEPAPGDPRDTRCRVCGWLAQAPYGYYPAAGEGP
jgi:hypothetical protein